MVDFDAAAPRPAAGSRRLPPQFLVLALENGTSIFLFLRSFSTRNVHLLSDRSSSSSNSSSFVFVALFQITQIFSAISFCVWSVHLYFYFDCDERF